jgi:predicted MFS family arabinose efflux permease
MAETNFISKKLTLLLGFSVGVIAANLYYAQPLAALMAHSLGLNIAMAGLVMTFTQVGYGIGVVFLVPLGDLIENRKVILILLGVAILALLGISFSTNIILYFLSTILLGVGASAIQIIVPYAAHLSPEAKRGQVVGSLMSGLMLGIMLSRPIAGILSDIFSWHAVYLLSVMMTGLISVLLYLNLPKRIPQNQNLRYSKLLTSMLGLLLKYPDLRNRGFYQACMFAAFCLFWTATPLLLAGPEFGLSQSAIAIFALVGVSGAIFAPLAGKFADRGFAQQATTLAFIVGALSFAMTHLLPLGSSTSLALLTIAAILLDAGVSANLVVGQRTIFALPAELRGRLNSVFIALTFIGGAFGSFIGTWAYAHGGWALTSWIGFMLPTTGLIYFMIERRVYRSKAAFSL